MRRKSTRETFQRYLGDKGQAQQKMAHTVLGPEQDEGTSDELHRKGTLVAQGGVDVEKRGDRRKEGRGKKFFLLEPAKRNFPTQIFLVQRKISFPKRKFPLAKALYSRIFLRDDDHTLKALVLANDTDLTHCK